MFKATNQEGYYVVFNSADDNNPYVCSLKQLSTDAQKEGASYLIVDGLSGVNGTISLESLGNPGYYLAKQSDNSVKIAQPDNNDDFNTSATFTLTENSDSSITIALASGELTLRYTDETLLPLVPLQM